MLPAELGPFVIEGFLGEGGSAIVYAAHLAASPGEPLALKVLHPELGLSPSEVERFLGEGEKLGRLAHPAIVALHSNGRLPDGRPYIAMPRLAGRTLSARLVRGAVPLDTALPLFSKLAEGVAALHANGLIHRDIKPDNVFWIEPDDRLVLLDLGIARDTEGDPSTTTRAGLSRGTPQYMAPERLFGSRATVRTDVYELALLFYVMLAGGPPWTEGDAQARLDPKVPDDMAAKLPAPLVSVLSDALALKVERRPESVDALLAAVEATHSPPPSGEAASEAAVVVPGVAPASVMLPPSFDPAQSPSPSRPFEVGPDVGFAPTERAAPLAPTPQAMSSAPQVTAPATSLPPPAKATLALPIFVAGSIAVFGVAAGSWFFARGGFGPPPAARSATPSETPTSAESSSAAPAPGASGAAQPGGAPSASAPSSAPSASAASTAHAAPSEKPSSAPTASSTASGAAQVGSPAGATPSCTGLVVLMCSPTSGALPEECSSWKGIVNGWKQRQPADLAEKTCAATLAQERAGLPLRKQHPLGAP